MDLYPLTAITLVLGVMLAALWWIQRRSRQSAQPDPIQRKRQIVLTPQHRLHVVQFGGRELLVATHPQGCTLLSRQRARSARWRAPGTPEAAPRNHGPSQERGVDRPAPPKGSAVNLSGFPVPLPSRDRGPIPMFNRPEAQRSVRTADRSAAWERGFGLLTASRFRNGAPGPVPVEEQR